MPDLMEGMFECHARMAEAGVHPVVHAAVIAFGFVFAHPFEDGNGRIHRFLIHNVLARRGLTPEGMIFPVSATMLRERVAYEESLEAFSKPLLRLLDYSFDDEAGLVVMGDTAHHYRFIDMTSQVEALFRFVRETIETDLVLELEFLRNYDETKSSIQEIVDLPDRRLDLFIRFCLQNRGQLSRRKRESHFAELTDIEVEELTAAVRAGYRLKSDI